jgi:hypothetical protein
MGQLSDEFRTKTRTKNDKYTALSRNPPLARLAQFRRHAARAARRQCWRLLGALVAGARSGSWLGATVEMAAVVEPCCCSVWACWRLRDALWRLPLRLGQAAFVLAGGLAAQMPTGSRWF